MKNLKTAILLVVLLISTSLKAEVIFFDDFESGIEKWSFTGGPDWGLTDSTSVSPNFSLTESPDGNYLPDMIYYATMANPLDLSSSFNAWMTYKIKYEIEIGDFDWGYVEVSIDGGTNWLVVLQFAAEPLTEWEIITVPLGGFVGNAEVFVRFSLITDGGLELDGMYIDNVIVTSENHHIHPPFIVYSTPPIFYEASLDAYTFEADLITITGISEAKVVYQVDGGSPEETMSTGNTGDTYYFEIPVQDPGSQVDFFISATDNSSNQSTTITDFYHYIQGEHLIYDNGSVDFYDSFETGNGAAVRMSIGENRSMIYALIRNYSDSSNNPVADIYEFHVWDNDNGQPGADLITPFYVTGEAIPENYAPMTRIDLSDVPGLSNISGDIFVGFIAVDETFITKSTTSGILAERSWVYNGSDWSLDIGTDFHFRVIFEDPTDIENNNYELSIMNYELKQNYPNPFNPITRINYELRNTDFEKAKIVVYNTRGQNVWSSPITDHALRVMGSILFDGSKFNSGIYYYSLVIDGIEEDTKSMILIK